MTLPLRAYFINRSKAKSASNRLLERFPHCATSVGMTSDAYVVTVTEGADGERCLAEALLREVGGRIESIEGAAPSHLRLVVPAARAVGAR